MILSGMVLAVPDAALCWLTAGSVLVLPRVCVLYSFILALQWLYSFFLVLSYYGLCGAGRAVHAVGFPQHHAGLVHLLASC
jgi:hypothetical protein